MRITGTSKNGKFIPDNPKLFAQAFYSLDEKRIVFEPKEIEDTRNLDQNNKYWSWMEALSEQTGYTPQELHKQNKEMFNLVVFVDGREKVLSTSVLSVKEFSVFMDNVARFYSSNGFYLE